MLEAAQEQVFRLVAKSDEALTKNCNDIITAHEMFFAGLNKIKQIIVIGHSLAPVDGDYFSGVASRLSDSFVPTAESSAKSYASSLAPGKCPRISVSFGRYFFFLRQPWM